MNFPTLNPRPTLHQILDRPDDVEGAGDRQIVKDHLNPKIFQETPSPWFVEALAGFGTWVAALFMVAAFFITGWSQYTEQVLLIGLGLTLAGALCRLLILPRGQGLPGRLLIACSLAGQTLCAFGLFESYGHQKAAALFAVLLFGLLLLDPSRLQAFVSALMIGIMTFVFFFERADDAMDSAALFCLFFLIGLLCWPPGSILSRRRRNSAAAGAASALVLLLVPTLFPDLFDQPPAGAWTTAGLTLVGLGGLAALGRQMGNSMNRELSFAAGLLVAVALLAYQAPGIPASLMLLGLGWWRQRAATLCSGVAFLLIFCFGFYYSLDLKLMEKSLILAATAAVLLLCRIAFLERTSAGVPSPASPATSARRSLFWVGLLAAMLVPSVWVVGKEIQLRASSPILLELAPVDPRSLMQGDYMILRFKLEESLGKKGRGQPEKGQIVVQPDEEGVAKFQRFYDPRQPLQEGQQLIAYRKKAGRFDLGHNAFFFEEGQGPKLSSARYAELRVDADGHGILSALLDGQRQVLVRN